VADAACCVNMFEEAAADARTNKTTKEAKNFLAEARSFERNLREDRARERCGRARSLGDGGAAADARATRGHDSLKSKLAAQVQLRQHDGPGRRLATSMLCAVLGGSVDVARDMPQITVGGYVHRCANQLAKGHVDEALRDACSARQKLARPRAQEFGHGYVAARRSFSTGLSTAIC